MTGAAIDPEVQSRIDRLLSAWHAGYRGLTPYLDIQAMLDKIRSTPVGDARVALMNSVVRTLGRPEALAAYLDMLRWAAGRSHPAEEAHLRMLQNVRMHSIYGWCGNTMLVESGRDATEHTYPAAIGLAEKLGNPACSWNLTLHVWQPNRRAAGFKVTDGDQSLTIAEPPHSHPFDFVSHVVVGRMWQSIYRQADLASPRAGRYAHTTLEHVDGVWPPHDFRAPAALHVVEERVRLEPGDSYYMPCELIHDVEIDRSSSYSTPTITLFMSSEYMVMPHVYMAKSMADYQEKHQDVKTLGRPILPEAWHMKLEALARYLRGESATLQLQEIVKHDGEYAFFHL